MVTRKQVESLPDLIKTAHPGQTEMERKILDLIGCGQYNMFDIYSTKEGHKAINDLIARDAIRALHNTRHAQMEFEMEIPTHMQWCKWGAENCTDEDEL